MANPGPTEALSLAQLDSLLDRAHDEEWQKLTILGPNWRSKTQKDALTDRTLRVKQRLVDVAKLATLGGLSFLDLRGNQIGDEGARALAALTSLSSISLADNQIGEEGARALAALTSLSSIDLGYNQIGEEGARALAALTSLSSIDLRYNQIGDEGARALAALTSLSSIDLRNNQIGDEGARALAALTSLSSIDLRNNQIGDEGARALAALTSLSSIDLAGNHIGDEGARALAALTSLSSIDLAGNHIGDEGARALAALTSLSSIDLGNNQIGDKGARALAALTSLSSIDLAGNQIGDKGARALSALTSLSSIDLRSNRIGEEGARALAALTSLSSIDLAGNHIGDEGARALAALTSLSSIDLASNQIGDEGACALAALTSLSSIFLGNNQIGDKGARALAALTSLSSIDVGNNQIGKEGARALAALTSLSSIDLRSNRIGDEGARALAALTSLSSIDLRNNQIGKEGARALAALTSLSSIFLGNNHIGDEGARALAALTSLSSIDLRFNQIGDKGARALAALTSLSSISLGFNQIGDEGVKALLDGLLANSSRTLRYLDLKGNCDLSAVIPAEVLKSPDAQAILAAHRRYRSEQKRGGLQPLNEAKLLVVGNEYVGKTSLIRYLVENRPRNEDEPKTPGTTIREKIETRAWSPEQGSVTLNVWDFGGQEIMHGTHRFFLTQRSLYLLVLQDRREDDRSVYEWLKTIENRGASSPVIVVINKSDDGSQNLQLDDDGIRREFPQIVAFVRTSCNADEASAATIARLRALIADTLATHAQLKHIRDPIPQTWLRVKAEITARARKESVLRISDYENLCCGPLAGDDAPNGDDAPDGRPDDSIDGSIDDEHEQRALLRLLHDLGTVVAHGLERDAPAVLREVTLLDPNWLTTAIYTLLNSPTVRNQYGIFAREQIGELLDPERYPRRWDEFILEMMMERDIGLCFRLPDSAADRRERYLIAEALPKNQPDYSTFPTDLRFRYQYAFVPPGLIPRFIVLAHRHLTDQPTLWRTGCVLSVEGCQILVRGNRETRRVDISVAGTAARRRSALSIVRDYFRQVHELNPGIEEEPRVPLPDLPERDAGYEHLLNLEEREGLDYRFYPDMAERDYSVRELLAGVRWDDARRLEREDWHGEDGEFRPPGRHWRGRPSRSPAARKATPAGRVDVLIITALQDELNAVKALADNWADKEDDKGFPYHEATLTRADGMPLRIAVAWSGKMGEGPAADRARTLIGDVSPRCLAMCGICAGNKDAVFLGDVIVAQRVYNYDHGKLVARVDDGERDVQVFQDVETYNLDDAWSVKASYFAEKSAWREPLAGTRPLSLGYQRNWLLCAMLAHASSKGCDPEEHPDVDRCCPDWTPALQSLKSLGLVTIEPFGLTDAGTTQARSLRRLHRGTLPEDKPFQAVVGVIATGAKVVKDPELFSRLEIAGRKTIGAEMEANAIGFIASREKIPSLIVKAVSDYGDGDKDDRFREFACRASATFLLEFCKHHPPPSK